MNYLNALRIFGTALALTGSSLCLVSHAFQAPPAPQVQPAPPAAQAQPAAHGPGIQGEQTPVIEKLANGRYRVGEIMVDKGERAITFPAQVNMDQGLLEYLIVHDRGKTHESLLRTKVEPYNLQIAFLLLGYQGTGQRLARQGDPAKPGGEPVSITITAIAGQRPVVIAAERWLVNKFGADLKDVTAIDWVFSGSFLDHGRFLAQETGSIVSIWHDPAAMMDNASPGGESNRIWFVKQGAVPPVGTPVQVSIRPAQ